MNQAPVEVSVLVPAKDEAENLPEFVRLCDEALKAAPFSFEVVVVDDGSRDETPKVLDTLGRTYPFLRVVTHRRQRGIADALRSAAEAANGEIFVFYPADLQYLPADIPGLVAPILAGEADIVTGTKQGRYEKAFVSGIYNRLCRFLFGVPVTDLNSVKAYRREIMIGQPLRPDWHRYMVVIAAADGFRLTSRPVPLHPRRAASPSSPGDGFRSACSTCSPSGSRSGSGASPCSSSGWPERCCSWWAWWRASRRWCFASGMASASAHC
ncbi:MAG: glycosyltransferase family 2 protein [Gemmatimonadota bacterium]|nr:glycosyltransferase family 2 protein [Gemmatimonadota bacterium]